VEGHCADRKAGEAFDQGQGKDRGDQQCDCAGRKRQRQKHEYLETQSEDGAKEKAEYCNLSHTHTLLFQRLLFLGSSCIYPKHAEQPIREDQLLTGPLEPTNEWYAIAKIAGLKMCQAYRRQFGDDYHPDHSHVPAALIRRFHEAKLARAPTVTVWGTGTPLREFLNVDDLADASTFLLKRYSQDMPINVGSGDELSIADFATLVAEVVGYQGKFVFDVSKPDGTPRKLLDSSRIRELGWRPQISMRAGLAAAYEDFLQGYGRNLQLTTSATN
jgi:GDP-L-fucose synthase